MNLLEAQVDGMSLARRQWSLMWLEEAVGLSIGTRPWARGLSERGILLRILGGAVEVSQFSSIIRSQAVPPKPRDVVTSGSARMPNRVRELARPPFGVRSRGNADLLKGPSIGIVGSRHPRAGAMEAARQIATAAARAGLTVVSGMAIGIDGVAHSAAMEAGGTTIAVLGSGIDHLHPRQHRRLAAEMVESGRGLLVSEYPNSAPALKWQFCERNRLIAALSDYVVVVQARNSSGSLQTADSALKLGVEVGAIPSFVGDFEFQGSLNLLRDGARTIIDGDSVLRWIGLEPPTTADLHQFGTMLDTPRSPDELGRFFQMPLGEVFSELLGLELDGLVRRTLDGRYENARASGARPGPH